MFSPYEIDRLANLFVQQLACRPWEMDETELPENTLSDAPVGRSDKDLEGENDDEAQKSCLVLE